MAEATLHAATLCKRENESSVDKRRVFVREICFLRRVRAHSSSYNRTSGPARDTGKHLRRVLCKHPAPRSRCWEGNLWQVRQTETQHNRTRAHTHTYTFRQAVFAVGQEPDWVSCWCCTKGLRIKGMTKLWQKWRKHSFTACSRSGRERLVTASVSVLLYVFDVLFHFLVLLWQWKGECCLWKE